MTVKFTGGKKKRYVNLRAFHEECPKRSLRGNLCTVQTLRCTSDGGGVAHVTTRPMGLVKNWEKARGTWKLRFASCSLLKHNLKGRVLDPKNLL